jgi:hypothetical protein
MFIDQGRLLVALRRSDVSENQSASLWCLMGNEDESWQH